MIYQKSKLDEKKKKYRKSRSPEYEDSEQGEMNYAEPTGNQFINTNTQEEENNLNEQQTVPVRPSLQGTIVQIKNELKNRMELAQIVKETPIESLEVNIPRLAHKSKSPKTINIGESKEDIEYNIRTLNNRKSPPNVRSRQNLISSDNLSGTDAPYQPGGEVQIQGLPDYRNQRQISFNPKGIILRSPNAPKRFKEFVYMPNDRSEENIRSPSNEMSPNINYEEMNNSGMGSRKGEELETKNYLRTNTGNIFASKVNNMQRKPTSGKQKILTNLSASGNSIDELPDKYKKSLNNNMNMGEVKRIMRRFTKIYDPNKNNNGALLGSTQVTVPGGQDEVFNSRYRVLAKMNRLSNILLSNRNRSPMVTYNRTSLLNRSRSRSLSRESLDKSIREKSVKKPRNRFLYVSLAMLSSKGPKCEDRVILRKYRFERGGVVDLAQEQRKKNKYKIRQVSRNVRPNSFTHMNPKYREKAAKIIQDWWRELKIVTSDRLKKIILIQSVYRGKWIRKNMYDLLYLNYLYICFCKKIEKVLLSNLRPYVFGKLFYDEKRKKELLSNIIQRKDENALRPYWNYWLKAIKSQHLINEASRKLLQIRSNKENKLSILLAFFNKWKYICRIGLPKEGDEYDNEKDDLTRDYNKVMPTGKLKCLVNILDATNKYTKQKAMDKILGKVMKYLTIQAKKTKLLKLLARKPIYVKILLRKKLYLWYRQMVNSQISFSNEDKIKVYEMKQKIFSLTFNSTIERVYRRIQRIYFRKLFLTNIPMLSDKKYKSIYDLIRDKLNNNSDFQEGIEETYDVDDKLITVIKKRNDLLIIDDKGNKSKLDNYKEVVKKKRYPLQKKDALTDQKENESGNEPYETSEEQNEEYDRSKKVTKKKRPSSEISGKEIKKRKIKEKEKEEIGYNEEEEGSERRSRFGVEEEEDKTKKKKPKNKGKGIIEEIITKKKEGKIVETRTKKKIPGEEEEDEYTEKIIQEEDSDGIIRKKKIKVPKTKKTINKYTKPEEEENEEIEDRGKPKQITKKTITKKHEKESSGEIDEATGEKRPKTLPKKQVKKKYTNRDGEIVEEDEHTEESEEIQKDKKKTKTVDKRKKPGKYVEKKIKKILDENGEEIEVEETPSEGSDKIDRNIYKKKEPINKRNITKRGDEIEVEEEENEDIDRIKPKVTDKSQKKKYTSREREIEEAPSDEEVSKLKIETKNQEKKHQNIKQLKKPRKLKVSHMMKPLGK